MDSVDFIYDICIHKFICASMYLFSDNNLRIINEEVGGHEKSWRRRNDVNRELIYEIFTKIKI